MSYYKRQNIDVLNFEWKMNKKTVFNRDENRIKAIKNRKEKFKSRKKYKRIRDEKIIKINEALRREYAAIHLDIEL